MKDKILMILKNSGDYCSGERISAELNISRAAVWKYIKKLKEDGYEIKSVTNKGYKIISVPDILSGAEIKHGLQTKKIGQNIFYSYEVDSTNNEAKRNNSAPDGSVFIAEMQNGGKGRRGRQWASAAGSGIWMSILLKPDISLESVSKITLVSGMAVCGALRSAGLDAGIKWPNDVVAGGKKLCGILTELSAETDGINYVVTGIGINVNTDDFSAELKEKATSVFLESGKKGNRAEIAKKVLEEFERLYNEFLSGGLEKLIADYKTVCVTLGRQVRVIRPGGEFDAEAVDITSGGELVVEKDGKKITLNSGEVSVRGIYGYV